MPSCLQLSHSQRSRTLQHIQWCPPLRCEILQWGGGRTCTPKKHRQTAKLGKVQQHLIKFLNSLWTSSANKNLEMMLLVMVIHEVLQLPTTPKKTRKFPLGTTLIPNPKPFFSSHHLQIIDPKFGNSVTRMLTRWSHHSKLLNLGDQQIFSPPTFCHLQNPEVDEMNLKHDYFTVVFQFFEYLWINIENPPGPSQPSAP